MQEFNVMNKRRILLSVLIIFMVCGILFSQDDGGDYNYENTYYETTYEYPSANVIRSDLKLSKYYGDGRYAPIASGDILPAITEEDALERYVTILHNSDGESSMLADDYSGSVAQFAAVVNQLREEAGDENTLLFSSGDNFLAGAQYQVSEGRLEARALNLMNYDASAIGNHEFDFGPDAFEDFAQSLEFPLISSNMFISILSPLNNLKESSVFHISVIERAGRNIGIVGATTEMLKYISSPDNTVEVMDVKVRLQEAVNYLRSRGLNVIVALTHLQNIEEEKMLASEIDGVDVFIAGGGDNLLGNENNEYLERTDRSGNPVKDQPEGPYPYMTESPTGEPVYVISTDGSYNYVGRLTIMFDENGIGTEVDYTKTGPVPVKPDVEPDSQIQSEIVEEIESGIEELKNEVIGQTNTGLDGTRGLVRTQETTMGNAICDGFLYTAKKEISERDRLDAPVDFAFTNGGGIRKSVVLEEGSNITVYDTLTILPFSNYLTLITNITPQTLKEMFERSVESLPEAGGQFLQVSEGIKVEYDSSKASGDRVVKITLTNYRGGNDIIVYNDGNFTAQAIRVNAVTNSFTADGGDKYLMLGDIPRDRKINLGYSYQEGFEVYIRENSPISAEIEGRLADVNQ
jgi:5'-nucleotidase